MYIRCIPLPDQDGQYKIEIPKNCWTLDFGSKQFTTGYTDYIIVGTETRFVDTIPQLVYLVTIDNGQVSKECKVNMDDLRLLGKIIHNGTTRFIFSVVSETDNL